MPFAGYKDHADCVAQNGGKDDPAAYCAALMHEAEKLDKQFASKAPVFGIVKLDDAQRLVFGWASVSKDEKDNLLEDLQGDLIEPDELEKAVYDFVLYGGGANEMHVGRMKGQLVESLMVTDDKLTAMKLKRDGAPAAAWWVGFKLESEVYEKVKAGQYRMFSIKGHSEAVAA